MIEFACKSCGGLLTINSSLTIASHTMIKIEPCEKCDDNRCIKETCDKFTELQDELQATITQQQVDIEGNDEMLQAVRKISEKWGGMIEKEINEILEGDKVNES